MALRANITTTYHEVSINPPRATKYPRKKEVDQGGGESDGNLSAIKSAAKTVSRGAVSQMEQKGNRSVAQNSVQIFAPLDAFKRSSKEKSTKADPGLDMQAGSMVKKLATSKLSRVDNAQATQSDGKLKASEPPDQSLPIAAPPKIRLAVPTDNAAFNKVSASSSNSDIAPTTALTKKADQSSSNVASGLIADPPDEDAMQSVLMTALKFEQAPEENSQTDSSIRIDVAKHLQSEGVFGISPNGRNLGVVDFIRQKQFEYSMDQKPFTADELLLEAEKAIHGTLNSDQSSSVSKSLLRATESINAYRNHSVKSSEQAEIAARPVRVNASTAKEGA
jgi:hypothetical protein